MSDVVLQHPSISRRHAAVLHDGKGGLFLFDLGSTHKTFVDGTRAEPRTPVPLRPGSRVTFAESSRAYILHIPGVGGAAPVAGSMPPPPAKSRVLGPTSRPAGAGAGAKRLPSSAGVAEEKSSAPAAPLRAEDILAADLPVSFGGGLTAPTQKQRTGALSKEEMAAGIAEMMKAMSGAGGGRSGGLGAGAMDVDDDDDDDEHEEGEGDDDDDDDDMGPRPARPGLDAAPEPEEEEEEAEPLDVATKFQIPVSHEVDLRGHSKQITSVAMDPAGSRVAVGSVDYRVLLYDFGGMDKTHKPFRELEPEEGNYIAQLSFR
jgi:hypothetical protein